MNARAMTRRKRTRSREQPSEQVAKAQDVPKGDAPDPAACLGKAFAEVLPHSDPPRPVPAKVPDEPPAAGFPLVGSDVLDVIGSEGAARRDMHDIIHAPDDEIVEHHLGPLEEAKVSFRPDPEVGDAGADFAEDFGRSYLQSATGDVDMSELEGGDELDPSEVGGPFLVVDEKGNAADESYVEETGGPIGEPVEDDAVGIPVDEQVDAALASEPPPGEVPPDLEAAGAAACPPDETREPGARTRKRPRPRARS
jgi:hypothetical protein